jgi:hypothetical protein
MQSPSNDSSLWAALNWQSGSAQEQLIAFSPDDMSVIVY